MYVLDVLHNGPLRTVVIADGVHVDWWTDGDGVEHVAGVAVLQSRGVAIDGQRWAGDDPAQDSNEEDKVQDMTGRHLDTQNLARWLTANPHLPEGKPANVAASFELMADRMIAELPDGPELTAGQRRLLEFKDCLVRAALT